MENRPFRNPDVFVTGHRSPKVVSWAAIKMDIKTNRPLLGIVVLPTVCWRYLRCWQPFTLRFRKGWFIPADALQGMVLGYLSHILADMLTPAGVPRSGHAAGISACLSWYPKGQPTGTFYLHGIICLVGIDAHSLPENSAVRWSSQMINTLQIQFIGLLSIRLNTKKAKITFLE